jgi:hypothetical protein
MVVEGVIVDVIVQSSEVAFTISNIEHCLIVLDWMFVVHFVVSQSSKLFVLNEATKVESRDFQLACEKPHVFHIHRGRQLERW